MLKSFSNNNSQATVMKWRTIVPQTNEIIIINIKATSWLYVVGNCSYRDKRNNVTI